MVAPLILRTKIIPPRVPLRMLPRPRVTRALEEALQYRLTLLQAGAGYGKSTALATLAEAHSPLIWYQVSEEDNDPLVFLLHLCHATRIAFPDIQGIPIPLLEAWDGTRGPLPSVDVVNQYLNSLSESLPSPTLLVVDDAHFVAETSEIAHILDRLIGMAPPDLHVVLSARPPLQLPNLSRWRVRGEVLSLDQGLLAFTVPEIAALYAHHYDYELTQDEIEALSNATEGWAITLQLIWQGLRGGAAPSVQEALTPSFDKRSLSGPTSLDSLFELLAHEVLDQQPADIQTFMRISAILRVMTPEACDALLDTNDSAALLTYLRRQELFVVEQGDGSLRYQNIFHQFLRRHTPEGQQHNWHSRAAAYFERVDNTDAAIYHLLRARDFTGAANLLASYGRQLLTTGRLDTLAAYLDALPPDVFQRYPLLLAYLGDLARLHSRFQEALNWYQQAETLWRERGQFEELGRALRGQARVYLDTVNPSRAEELLQQALRLSDGTADRETQARLSELLAENKLNAGKPDEAERLRKQAATLRREGPSDSQLLYRVLLRTGRLAEARKKLEAQLESELVDPVHTPRAHRETHFLLSIIYAFQGEAEAAYRTAVEGTQRGISLASPFVTAVGHMRQGHALMLLAKDNHHDQARIHFEKTIEISRTLAVPRLRVEAFWGLCRVYGQKGDLTTAFEVAAKGIEIAAQAGDEWIASLTRMTMGGSLLLAARYEPAAKWLNHARRGFEECSDSLGATAAQLWLCLGWFRQNDHARLAQNLPGILSVCRQHGYDFLFTRPTILGVLDERIVVPLLTLAREHEWEPAYVSRLLRAMGLAEVSIHPGYRLRVRTLGSFQAWQGKQPIPSNGWRRAATRKLFQLLLTYHDTPLNREQIFEHLWPGAEPAAAQRNFKVALNTLYKALEPNRPPGADSAFILREGTVYALRPGADLWLDAREFPQSVRAAEELTHPGKAISAFEDALALYQGEYLPEARYETWAAGRREQLAVLFLQAADRLCELYLQTGRLEETVALARRILGEDRCWERAYQHLMQAYVRLGDHGQAARAYHRCVETLREELEVPPSAETEQLYRRLTAK